MYLGTILITGAIIMALAPFVALCIVSGYFYLLELHPLPREDGYVRLS